MKKAAFLILAVILLVSSTLPVMHAEADTEGGRSFTADESYLTMFPVTVTPCVIEAMICVPESASSDRVGVIIGNYGGGASTVNFEIHSNGRPRIYWINPDGVVIDRNFNKVNVCTGEWLRITVVRDAAAEQLHCYIDGELKQTIDMKGAGDIVPSVAYAIGGDLRGGNAQYFKGYIKTVSMYSAVKSADEIRSGLNTESQILSFDLAAEGKARLEDLSGNNRHLKYINRSDPSLNEAFVDSSSLDEDSSAGIKFESDDRYILAKVLQDMPHTFEARVFFPSDTDPAQRGGVIFGNYGISGGCLNFEIHSNGRPRLYFTDSENKVYDYVFTSANVFNGKWTDVALVCDDDAGQLRCYINGEQVQSVEFTVSEEITGNMAPIFGGDLRSGNERYFTGKISRLNIYAEARTAAQILNDYRTPGGDGPMISYSTDGLSGKDIPDDSGNGYTAEFNTAWLEAVDNSEYAYSIAVIGDTQILAERAPDAFSGIYDWILEQRESMKIRFVIGLGDITNGNTSAEWEVAESAITKLDGKILYSLVRGNHDGADYFNRNFPYDDYEDVIKGCYDGSLTNSWQALTVGQVNYLIMSLDYGASDDVLTWANKVVGEHPEYRVIVTTHCYLFRDGTTLDDGDVCPPSIYGGYNDGDDMWDKFVSKHENIVLVLSGHDPCDNIIVAQDKADAGNMVTQMLIDPQGLDNSIGATGLVALLHFSENGRQVQVNYYATAKKLYFGSQNQFELTLDVPDAGDDASADNDTSSVHADPTPADPTLDRGGNIIIYIAVAAVVIAAATAGFLIVRKKPH